MRRNILAGPISVLFAASILAVSAASCAEPKKAETPTTAAAPDAAFGEKVRAYLIAHPEVIAEAIEALKTKQQAEAEASNAKAIAQNKAQLEHAVGDPSLGAGPVTVVEFFDYRCAYCKAAAPHIPDMVAKNSQIRLVFKEFPILTEVSEHAARAALAAQIQGKYLPVHLAFMAEKALDDDGINRILKEKGVDLVRAHADMQSEPVSKKIEENRALAREIGVDGTPGFVVADKVIGGFIEDDIIAATKAKVETPKTGT